jgi:thiamine biosynthesis lipoprotein
MEKQGALPDPAQLADARSKVGMHLVELDPANFTVRFARPGVMLDLGAIGKGYAVEQAVLLLREAGVSSAFLHGGTSTAYALGAPPDAPAWKVALDYPPQDWQEKPAAILGNLSSFSSQPSANALAIVPLKDQSISVSAVWGRFFQSNHTAYGHILDPRTGEPVSRALLAAVVLPSATETDALSTALLAAASKGHDAIQQLRAEMRSLVLESGHGDKPFRISSRGIEVVSCQA